MWPIYLDVLSGAEGKGYVGVALAKRVPAECPQRQRPRRGLLPFQENICICLCVCVLHALSCPDTENAHRCQGREPSCSKFKCLNCYFSKNADVNSNLMFLP